MATTPLGMTSPENLAAQGIEAGAQTEAWIQSTIHMESLLTDIYTRNQYMIDPIVLKSDKDEQSVYSDKMIMKITPGKEIRKSDNKVTLFMTEAIDDDGVDGNGGVIGTEFQITHKYTSAYANDFKVAITEFGFGIDELNAGWLTMGETGKRLLKQWKGEKVGLQCRQAYCETISANLEASPLSLTPAINPNMVFPEDISGAGFESGIIDFDATLATYKSNITAASAAVTPADNHLTIGFILRLGEIAASNFYISPLIIDGEPMYKLMVAPEEIIRLKDSQLTGSYAKDYIAGSALAVAKIAPIVPEASLVIENIIVCKDVRNPTYTAAGSIWGYMGVGKSSSRAGIGAEIYNVNVLCGAMSSMQFERKMFDFHTQKDEYGAVKGTLIIETSGYALPMYDVDSPTTASMQYEGGLLVMTSREKKYSAA